MATDDAGARVDELRALVDEIAPLPWALVVEEECLRNGEDETRRFLQHDGQVAYEFVGEIWYGDAEARYVRAAVNAVPALLAERDALLARCAAAEAALQAIAAHDSYPEEIFTPLTEDEANAVCEAIGRSGVRNAYDRTYAIWGRHVGGMYRRMAREALTEAQP